MKILKIGAIWCPGCLVMRPIWKRIEAENLELVTEYFEFDERKDIVAKYQIQGGVLPVFIFLDKEDNELLRLTGEVSRERLLQAINDYKDK
jgi:thiol-disulfide isomerase/thioredoxin